MDNPELVRTVERAVKVLESRADTPWVQVELGRCLYTLCILFADYQEMSVRQETEINSLCKELERLRGSYSELLYLAKVREKDAGNA